VRDQRLSVAKVLMRVIDPIAKSLSGVFIANVPVVRGNPRLIHTGLGQVDATSLGIDRNVLAKVRNLKTGTDGVGPFDRLGVRGSG
jgi:hypothetical protein